MEIELNENIYLLAKEIIEDSGLEIDYAINIFLKKVIKENSIGFLFTKRENEVVENDSISEDVPLTNLVNVNKMTKSIAKRLFVNTGLKLCDNCIFASENMSTHIYWANMHYSILSQDWSLILNDKSSKTLYLLFIPAKTFNATDLVMRADKPEVIDLQIAYNDPTFTDNRSKMSFGEYIVKTINY